MPKWKKLVVAVAALLTLAPITAAGAQPSAPDADGLNLDLRRGPDVWVEEHWDVKPDNLEQFLEAYDREFYSLARQTPGYRGYTVLTTLPAIRESDGTPSARLGGYPPFIRNHSAIRLQGRIKTEKLANWDNLFGQAFNVVIIHHIQTWNDADKFRARVAALHGKRNGETLGDHLAKTLFIFADNYWWADYRMVTTGWQEVKSKAPRQPRDSDGLNLEPRKGAVALVGEHWEVKPERFCDWLRAYERDVYSVIRRTEGYRGYSVATSLPPQKCEGKVAPVTAAGLARLGGSDEMYMPAPGVMMKGLVRTDTSINVGAVYKKTFNVILMHQLQTWEDSAVWSKRFNAIYARENDGASFVDLWSQNLMTHANNHWDTYLRIVKTSFIPDAAKSLQNP